ncbi:MAG: hypothetical protein Q4F84_00090, partial [Fibrobacter sp.]|nr:hypothetical protein [Fibrobacter sp.]
MDLDIGKHLVVLGMNHSCSGVLVRERVFLTQAQIPDALRALKQIPDVNECLILSTCNRIEIYAVVANTDIACSRLLQFVADYKNIEIDKFKKHTYFFCCNEAVRHFYEVIASLDSLVIGEGQIVSQVKNAYRTAWENGVTGPFIN